MAIDIDTEITAGFFLKWMSVKKMKEALDNLNDDDMLYPNNVGNLAAMKDDKMIGYIDFNSETFESAYTGEEDE